MLIMLFSLCIILRMEPVCSCIPGQRKTDFLVSREAVPSSFSGKNALNFIPTLFNSSLYIFLANIETMVCNSRHYLERTENQYFNYFKHKQNSHKNTFVTTHLPVSQNQVNVSPQYFER